MVLNRYTRIALQKFKDFIITKSFKYKFDNLGTNNNLSILSDSAFLSAYNKGITFVGSDLNIPLRVHQAIWSAVYASEIDGDFMELGTGKGFTFAAVMEYISNFHPQIKKQVFLIDTFLPNKPDETTGTQNNEKKSKEKQ
jgi:hypothetical protein